MKWHEGWSENESDWDIGLLRELVKKKKKEKNNQSGSGDIKEKPTLAE